MSSDEKDSVHSPARVTPSTAHAIGYARVSTDEQVREGVSLDVQKLRIRAYAQAKGLSLIDVLVDEGVSGKNLNRPALGDLLSRCNSKSIGHVIVWKLDRGSLPATLHAGSRNQTAVSFSIIEFESVRKMIVVLGLWEVLSSEAFAKPVHQR